MYKVPEKSFFRIHHIRPRFKNDIENVLIFMATELVDIGIHNSLYFKKLFNERIRKFPGNLIKEEKTINNWRTEISSLFGLVQKNENDTYAGMRAQELAEKQDLVEFFKKFLYFFQFPGGHLKPHENLKLIEAGVKFQPAKYILSLLLHGENNEEKRAYINKAELTHIVFNDLCCTSNQRDFAETWRIITDNRINKIVYDWTGDVIRYAGDILDYMEIANLLVCHNGNYYLNHLEDLAIQRFVQSDISFTGYDKLIQKREATLQEIKKIEQDWFSYVNQPLSEDFFKTDVLAFISETTEEYEELKALSNELLNNQLESSETIRAKEIGDWGESLVHGHECMKIKLAERLDLIHLIKRIPTQLAVGYDIRSFEKDGTHRLIEVKTTISSKPIEFSKIHLTPNEWAAAESFNDRYFVYRLSLSKKGKKLFVLSNPVNLYKDNKVKMIPRNGADITFDEKTCGQYEELLEWIS